MSRQLLSIVALVALVLGLSVAPSMPRHVNPARVPEERPFPSLLALLYAELFDSVAKLSIENASKVLKCLEKSYAPPMLRYVMQRFNQLMRKLLREVNETKSALELARREASLGDARDARIYLERARVSLGSAWATYYDLRGASTQLANLGVPPGIVARGLTKCRLALEKLGREIDSLSRELEEKRLVKTVLTISVEPRSVTVGSYVEVSGCLATERGVALPNRVVVIHVGKSVEEVRTDARGCFIYDHRVSFYVHRVPVYAEYIPRGADAEVYSYARSPTLYLRVNFVPTPLAISVNTSRALPGSAIGISVSTVPNTTVVIANPFTRERVEIRCPNGFAEASIRVPTSVAEGAYSIAVEALPHGVYGPSSRIVRVEVYRLEPRVSIEAPSTLFTGFTLSVKVSVEPTSRVTVCVPALNACNESIGGRAALSIRVPITTLATIVKLYVSVKPLDPRYRSVTLVREIHLYSTPCIAASALLVSPLALAAIRRGKGVARARARRESIEAPAPPPRRVLDPIIELLEEVLNHLARIVGRAIRPSETLREYLAVARNRLGVDLGIAMERIVRWVEAYLYGPPHAVTSSFKYALLQALRKVVSALRGSRP